LLDKCVYQIPNSGEQFLPNKILSRHFVRMPSLNHPFPCCWCVLVLLLGCFNPVSAQQKLSPNLRTAIANTSGESIVLTATVKDTVQFRKSYGPTIRINKIHKRTKCISFTMLDARVLTNMQTDPNILFIDTNRKPHTEGNFDLVNPAINRINQARQAFPTLHGAGYSVSIKEENFDPDDLDLKGRTFNTSVTPTLISQHATIMAVLVGGAGNSSPQAKGVADQISLTASNFNNLMPDDDALFTDHNILTQNHSYGVNIENFYGNEAVAYDQQIVDHPTLMHIFSSGNIGVAKPTEGTYKDLIFANLTGTFKQSKNVLVVSAIDTTLRVNAFNSRGPAYDGRLKPELTAYGPGGTSEAAAITSGMVTLIQEKYQLTHGTAPDAAMVKAILIASADDIRTAGIDFVTGYGNINANKALRIVEQNQLWQTTLADQDQISFPITINAGVAELKVAVTWTDPPAAVNSPTALVNDIDSWIDTGAGLFLPWVLSPFPHADSLNKPARRKQDHVNNVEFITLSDPAPGTYQLILNSGTLAGASQKVSVAYYFNNAVDFSWSFPVATDIVTADMKNLLVWEAQTDQAGDLYVQINSGDWQLVQAQTDLKALFKWKPPNMLAKAKLKMVIAGNDFLSEEFLISPQLQLKTAFSCTDSVGIYWNKLANATSYDVLTVGDQYLQPLQSTTDTLLVFGQPAPTYFAVVPRLNGDAGVPSGTIDYSTQGAFCYLNFFSALRSDIAEIEINLSLSSFYDVDHVTILKTVNGVQSIFTTITTPELIYEFLDLTTASGIHTYQAQIVFSNGLSLLSDPVELIIEEPGKVILWPNPVTPEDYLNIISEGNRTFRILNQLGEVVLEKELTLLKDELDIDRLPSGLYIYQLLNHKTITDTGRIIKL
jgi:hypothetical protein